LDNFSIADQAGIIPFVDTSAFVDTNQGLALPTMCCHFLWRTPLKQGQHDGDVPRTAPFIALAAYHSTAYLAKGKLTLPVLAIGGEAAFGTMMATVMHFAAIDA
jgi:hypothetical protein